MAGVAFNLGAYLNPTVTNLQGQFCVCGCAFGWAGVDIQWKPVVRSIPWVLCSWGQIDADKRDPSHYVGCHSRH